MIQIIDTDLCSVALPIRLCLGVKSQTPQPFCTERICCVMTLDEV